MYFYSMKFTDTSWTDKMLKKILTKKKKSIPKQKKLYNKKYRNNVRLKIKLCQTHTVDINTLLVENFPKMPHQLPPVLPCGF